MNQMKKKQYHILLSFAHPHVIPNLYDFLSSVEDKGKYFKQCWWPKL